MKVTLVSLRSTPEADAAGRPALTPELLAASGARYSRNNEGLDAILARIDPANLDKSVDSIFKMIDYGHQSIADMAPVAIFVDGISIWLAYLIWSLCPTAGGQESSTRYIRYASGESSGAGLGIPEKLIPEWSVLRARAFAAFDEAWRLWEDLVRGRPELLRLPIAVAEDRSERAGKQVARMRRNFGFDRARYFLPAATSTNVMLVMSARGWVQLCRHLLSHPLPESRAAGAAIRDELALATPRLLKHATASGSTEQGIRAEFEALRNTALRMRPTELEPNVERFDREPTPYLDVFPPTRGAGADVAADLEYHENRYAWIGPGPRRMAVRFGWDAVTLAEIRDLNRHRTGNKYCPPIPQGFYAAIDEAQMDRADLMAQLHELADIGREASARALELLRDGDPTYVYWTLLGTQFPFEHVTTADKFLYEAELRTGTGAHYRYARHLRDALALWYERFPETRGLVLEGSAEPE